VSTMAARPVRPTRPARVLPAMVVLAAVAAVIGALAVKHRLPHVLDLPLPALVAVLLLLVAVPLLLRHWMLALVCFLAWLMVEDLIRKLAGNDLRKMAPSILDILTNCAVIAIDQDPLWLQGRRVKKDGDFEVWSKQLRDGGRAVALLNRSSAEKSMSVSWTDIGYPEHVSARVRDLWAKKDIGKLTRSYSATVPSHGAAFVKILPE